MESHTLRHTSQPPGKFGAAVALMAVIYGLWYMATMDSVPEARQEGSTISVEPARGNAAMPAAGGSNHRSACSRCGVIESVRPVDRAQNPPGIASLSDGQSGEIMKVLHLVLNAMVGNSASATGQSAQSYQITVRFHDGSTRTLTETGTPAWKTGDSVKVMNGRIHRAT